VDTSVIQALRGAVERDPGAHAVRLHLAGLLVLGGDPTAALDHVGIVLTAQPDNAEALATARDAARALGDAERVAAYERLLGFSSTPAGEPVPLGAAEGRGEAEGEDDDDEAGEPAGYADEERTERPTLRLSDVGGMGEVKARLESAFLAPLRNPELREYYGKSLRGGLLLYGPPGCGKTFIARALAGELGAGFFSVGLSDVLDMWLGESERRLHGLFELARRSAPCVVFLDEINALGRKRSQLRQSAGRNVINQRRERVGPPDPVDRTAAP
jgi:hypothetical protein